MRKFATLLAVLVLLTVTLSMAVLTSPVQESLAHGNTTSSGNQTSAANNTGSSNDTGSVSGFAR